MPTKFQFGDFLLDADEESLYRAGQKVNVNRRTLQVLRLLIERRDEIVSKQEFLDTVWADSFVEEANLSVAIAAIRKVLGDDPKQPKFIQNIPRKGYRFIVDVTNADENKSVDTAESEDAVEQAAAALPPFGAQPFYKKYKTMIAASAILLAAVLIVFGYKGFVNEPVQGAWANIPSDLKSHFSEKEKKYIETHGTDNREAYLHYLKGRYYWDRREEKIGDSYYDKAVDEFKLAIDKDPTFALPYTGVANALAQMSGSSKNALPNEERYRVITSYLRKAIEIDPTLSEAHASLGMNELFLAPKPQWKTAEREYRRAIELDPSNAQARHWLAEYLAMTGKFDESLAEYDRAIELDPLSMGLRGDKCNAYIFARRNDEAVRCIEEVISLDPNFMRTYWYAFSIYSSTGDIGKAMDIWSKLEYGDDNELAKQYEPKMRVAFESGGARAFWRVYLEFCDKSVNKGGFGRATALAKLGDTNDAFTELEKVVAAGGGNVAYLKVWPYFDELRDDPRWDDVLARVGLTR